MSQTRRLIFYGALCAIVVLAIEASNQLLLLAVDGRPVWSRREQFNIRPFTERVDDARAVTMRRNFASVFKDEWTVAPWQVSTDRWGFRKGTHSTDSACPSLAFIGASVPFGWGVPDAASLPSKVYDRMRKAGDARCVVNAAIPSATLFQAIARYEVEIRGKLKVDAVFLQIYDPVSQLLVLGPQWRPEANWTSYSQLGLDQTGARLRTLPLSRYSATMAIAQRTLQGLGAMAVNSDYREVFSPDDQATAQRFRKIVRSALERLHAEVMADGARQLLLGSIAVPLESQRAPWFSAARRFAIDMMNAELRRFAHEHKATVYVDTAALLGARPDRKVYIDACCHLTERGNELVADDVVRLLVAAKPGAGMASTDETHK